MCPACEACKRQLGRTVDPLTGNFLRLILAAVFTAVIAAGLVPAVLLLPLPPDMPLRRLARAASVVGALVISGALAWWFAVSV